MAEHAQHRFHLIANSKSGRGGGGTLKTLAERLCKDHGFELVFHEISDPEKLQSIAEDAVRAAEQDGGIVAAAGGDGTVRSVAQLLIGKKTPLAVIPCGTFNLFARTHKIPEDHEAAVKLALTGETRAVRVGKVNDEIFILNASIGLYAKAIEERKNHAKRFGRHRLVALFSTAKTLLKKHRLLEVELSSDGTKKHLRTSMIFIGNNSLQLKNLKMKIADCMNRDLLAVVTMKATRRWEMFQVLLRGVSHTLEKDDHVDTFCVDTLKIETRKKNQRVALDGEMFELTSPFIVCSLPQSLTLVVPQNQ